MATGNLIHPQDNLHKWLYKMMASQPMHKSTKTAMADQELVQVLGSNPLTAHNNPSLSAFTAMIFMSPLAMSCSSLKFHL